MAALHQYPIMYFVQDNGWDISANAAETRAQNAAEYAVGFKGIETRSIDGADFFESYNTIQEVIHLMRIERRPFLIHGTVPLLGHHTSGVRREWYRDDLEEHQSRDPLPRFRNDLLTFGFTEDQLKEIEGSTRTVVEEGFEKAKKAEEPDPLDLENTTFAPTPITEEKGVRSPENGEVTLMVDCALHAVEEIGFGIQLVSSKVKKTAQGCTSDAFVVLHTNLTMESENSRMDNVSFAMGILKGLDGVLKVQYEKGQAKGHQCCC